MTHVWHYDGASAIRHKPEIIPDGDGFRLRSEGGMDDHYLWTELVSINGTVYGYKHRKGWRLGFIDPAPPEILRHLPKLTRYGAWVDRFGLGPAIIGFTAISLAFVGVVMKAPEWLAPLVPLSWEKQLGDAMVGDFGGRFCNGPGGQEALDALVKRIEPSGNGLKVRVANINMVNAVALPGGTIIIFRGLLQEAKSPDELAGVIGHEIGHVRNRDVMQSLLRQAGLSVLLGGVGGDAGGYANTLVSATYSRDAEAEADAFSIGLMQRANVSPKDTAGFFARLSEGEKALGEAAAALGYISSHPMSKTREAMFRKSANPKAAYTASITPPQWRALIDSCANDTDVKADDGLFF
ncbi:MAG: M48 family metallopeptidase [Pseudomonadota bacterium]